MIPHSNNLYTQIYLVFFIVFFHDVFKSGVANGMMGDDFAVVDDGEGAKGTGDVLYISCVL